MGRRSGVPEIPGSQVGTLHSMEKNWSFFYYPKWGCDVAQFTVFRFDYPLIWFEFEMSRNA